MSAFISYSWDSKEHKSWVKGLAQRLEDDGIDVKIDQWGLALGQQLPQFMETSIRDSDHVIIICTPEYKEKSDRREGGTGFEGHIIGAELLYKHNHFKYVPVWRSGDWEEAAPTSLLGSYHANLREDNRDYESEYIKLINHLRGIPPKAPKGSKAPAVFDDDKIYKVTEYLLGRAYGGPYGIRYTDGYLITEDDIRDILLQLKRYTGNGYWINILHRDQVDEIIDGHMWKNGSEAYFYDEAERREIMARCARSIQYRLEQYAGKGHIEHIIYQDGDIGFRYK